MVKLDSNQKHIAILGSSPSGLVAAINLAKHGYSVTVYEQKEKPGARFLNGWQILENYSSHTDVLSELSTMNLAHNFDFHPKNTMSFYDSRLRQYDLSSKNPFGYFVKRGIQKGTLDTSLHEQAIQAGVTFHFNSRIDIKEADIVSGGSMYASGIAKELVFQTDANDTFMTILDEYLTPLGFSYLFIINGHGTIGTAVLRNFNHIHSFTENVALRFQQIKPFKLKNSKESVSSVGFFLPQTAAFGGKLYVGEAAGFQDFLFGIGIRRSLQSGFYAAQSIITGTDYDTLWKHKIGIQICSGILNRFFYEQLGNAGFTGLLRLGKHFDFQKTGYFLQNPSIIRKLLIQGIKSVWGNRKECKHGKRCAWCRPPVKI